ncbi:MAG: hypothetical protein QOF83_1963 [Solirubrobacteraceae bacterium]|jgi:hypothetical protein|nr:hypothetical protein [Solirubrobacteraceae bacterium]
MLLKRRPPGISTEAPELLAGFEHLEGSAIAVVRWLNANKIDFVLVGPVARAIRGEAGATGPVAIVPAPYRRNWERLCVALIGERAGLRAESAVRGPGAIPVASPVKLTAEKLSRGRRWLLRCGPYDLDIEGLPLPEAGSAPDNAPGYQELLYEATRFEIADGVSVEVAAPEDLEHYSHVRRTGSAPEFRVTRTGAAERHTA